MHLFTSESVTEGHPDKVCDRISDAVLDACLVIDPDARVAVETLITRGLVLIAGELTLDGRLTQGDVRHIAQGALSEIGYDGAAFDVQVRIQEQSPNIAQGVDRGGGVLGAGDQGMMFGFACGDTSTFMPMPIHFAHLLTRRLARVRKAGNALLGPDGKAQVTVAYNENGRPQRVTDILVSTQHVERASPLEVFELVEAEVVPVIPEVLRQDARLLVNPTGAFVVGGPEGDTGLTGRKIIVDTYGGMGRHGGGAFSGKDPTKVDRSAAYRARQLAKTICAAGVGYQIEVQLAYAIGIAEPVSVRIEVDGEPEHNAAEWIERLDMTPAGIIKDLGLQRPIYAETSAYGHFGREHFPWEQLLDLGAARK